MVDADWVPGASEGERRALFALGGIARALIGPVRPEHLGPQMTEWLAAAPEPPSEVLDDAKRVIVDDRDQALASMYSVLVRASNRRQLGTFFTPTPEVKLMLDLWTASNQPDPSTVVDVGAGVGVFTAEAALRWPEAEIIAIDVNPVTLGLLAVRMFASEHESDETDAPPASRINLVLEDFTTWIATGFSARGSTRLILGNPPYTRAQLLSGEDRVRFQTGTRGLTGSRASLSTVIAALSLLHLGDEDGLCLLLPAQWLETQYARPLRTYLWEQTHRRVELRLVDSAMFADAQVDAVALLVGVRSDTPQQMSFGRWKAEGVRAIDRANAAMPDSWRSLFTTSPPNLDPDGSGSEVVSARVIVGDLAAVHRGVATGANSFFIMGEDEIADLPAEALIRVITRLPRNSASDANAAESPRWLLTCEPVLASENPHISTLIAQGEKDSIHERYLCKERDHWFDLTNELFFPDVIVGAMTRDKFRFVPNPLCATITNNLYGLKWKSGLSNALKQSVLDWLTSDAGQSAVRNVARSQGDGLLKIEPGALRKLELPDELLS